MLSTVEEELYSSYSDFTQAPLKLQTISSHSRFSIRHSVGRDISVSLGPNPVSPHEPPSRHENKPIFEEPNEYEVKEFSEANHLEKTKSSE